MMTSSCYDTVAVCREKTLAEKEVLEQRLSEAEVLLQSLWTQAAAYHDLVKADCMSMM